MGLKKLFHRLTSSKGFIFVLSLVCGIGAWLDGLIFPYSMQKSILLGIGAFALIWALYGCSVLRLNASSSNKSR